MKWNKCTSIPEVGKYIIGEDDVFVICENKISSQDELIQLPLQSRSNYNPIFLTFKHSVFYSNFDRELFKFNSKTNKETKIEEFSGALSSNNKNIFVVVNEFGTRIIDIEEEVAIREESVRLSSVITSSRFVIGKAGRKGKEVIVIDIKNDSSFNIPLVSKLIQIINVKEELVVLFYDDGTVNCFDLATKEELWSLQLVDGVESHLFSNLLFEENANKVYLLASSYLFELDIKEKICQLAKNYNEESEFEWYFKDSRLYSDLITFTGANTLGKFPMVAGVIERSTKEILWTIKCEPGVYFEEAPQIKDDKLYILDSNKTLHIFEK